MVFVHCEINSRLWNLEYISEFEMYFEIQKIDY